MRLLERGLDVESLRKYLKRHGWKKFDVVVDDPQQTAILTGWAAPGGGPHLMSIELDKAADSIDFQVPGIGMAPREKITAGELADVLMALAFSNFATRIGAFSYDPNDGEIRLRYSYPLNNGTMSFEQLNRILDALVSTTEIWAPRIAGIVGGERTGDSVIDSFVVHLRDAGVL